LSVSFCSSSNCFLLASLFKSSVTIETLLFDVTLLKASLAFSKAFLEAVSAVAMKPTSVFSFDACDFVFFVVGDVSLVVTARLATCI